VHFLYLYSLYGTDIDNIHYRIRHIPNKNCANSNDIKICKLTCKPMKKQNPHNNRWESVEFKLCDDGLPDDVPRITKLVNSSISYHPLCIG
jgi:hypothetical protein